MANQRRGSIGLVVDDVIRADQAMVAVDGRWGKGDGTIPWIPTDPRQRWLPCALVAVLMVTVGVGLGVGYWGGGGGAGGTITPPPSATVSPRPSNTTAPSVTATPSPLITLSPQPSITASPAASCCSVTLRLEPDGLFIPAGVTVQMTAVGYLSDGTTVDLAGSNVVWTSTNPLVASFSTDPATPGLLTALAPGQVNINVAADDANTLYSLVNIADPASVDCPPDGISGSNLGMLLTSDPGEHADEIGIDPPTAGWQFEMENGEISLHDGPAGLEEFTAPFSNGCNFETAGVGDFGSLTVPYTAQGSYGGPSGLKLVITIGPDGELGSPPTIYSN